MWIKICGLTNLGDAQKAASLGVDALGFIFTESRRKISPEAAREIILKLPKNLEKIGVFVNRKPEEAARIAGYCGLTGLQFHGEETPEYCSLFPGFQVTKAFRVDHEKGWDQIPHYLENKGVDRILLDTYIAGIPGGTGRCFPWKLAGK